MIIASRVKTAGQSQRHADTTSDSVRSQLEEFMSSLPCTACGGVRLRPESLAVTVHERSLGDVVEMSIDGALNFFQEVTDDASVSREIAGPILKEVRERLQGVDGLREQEVRAPRRVSYWIREGSMDEAISSILLAGGELRPSDVVDR